MRGLTPDQNVVTQGSLLINDVLADAANDTASAQPADVKPMARQRRPGRSRHDAAPAMEAFRPSLTG